MVEKIKLFLREKIDETEQSFKTGFPSEIGTIKIRHYLFSIKPVNYVKDPNRIGQDEVSLNLEYENESGECYRTTMKLRISPERKGGPAVSGWVEGRKGNFGWEVITRELFNAREFSRMNIWEFYKFWVERICKRNDSEIFRYKRKINCSK